MNAVITVVGKDAVGILAKTAAICASHNANIVDVTQTVLGDIFSMVMLADVSKLSGVLSALSSELSKMGKESGLVIYCMHEDIFNSMHRI